MARAMKDTTPGSAQRPRVIVWARAICPHNYAVTRQDLRLMASHGDWTSTNRTTANSRSIAPQPIRDQRALLGFEPTWRATEARPRSETKHVKDPTKKSNAHTNAPAKVQMRSHLSTAASTQTYTNTNKHTHIHTHTPTRTRPFTQTKQESPRGRFQTSAGS